MQITINAHLKSKIDGFDLFLCANISNYKILKRNRFKKINDTLYQLTINQEFKEDELVYKYVIINQENWHNEKEDDNITDRIYRFSKIEKDLVINDSLNNFYGVITKGYVGNLDIIENFYIPQLKSYRTIRVWTPSNYNKEISLPVIYMHDGQNLFDNQESHSGKWAIDQTIEQLIKENKTSGYIVVGIDNCPYRIAEYTPSFNDSYFGVGYYYAKFIVDTLKPFIDERYNTLKNKENTIICGSSMGGLISYYTTLLYPDVFGLAICFSTALQFTRKKGRMRFLKSLKFNHYPLMYFDSGEIEKIFDFALTMKNELLSVGYQEDRLIAKKYPYHDHNEAAWKIRFKEILIDLHNKILNKQ